MRKLIVSTTGAALLASGLLIAPTTQASASGSSGATSCSTAKGNLRAGTYWSRAGGVTLHDITATRKANYKPKGQTLTYKYSLHSITAYRPGTNTRHTPTVWYSNGKWHTYTHRGDNLDIRVTWVADKPLTAGYQPQYASCTLRVR